MFQLMLQKVSGPIIVQPDLSFASVSISSFLWFAGVSLYPSYSEDEFLIYFISSLSHFKFVQSKEITIGAGLLSSLITFPSSLSPNFIEII